jgi:release factor glutamine methyltransferase
MQAITRRVYSSLRSVTTPIHEAIQHGEIFLSTNNYDGDHESRLLLSHLMKRPLSEISLLSFQSFHAKRKELNEPSLHLTQQQWSAYTQMLQRRKQHEPIQYIIGETCFYGRDFIVADGNYRVLIPRPDSETLIDTVKALVTKKKFSKLRMLDIGTGSGCLILTLSLELGKIVPIEAFATDKEQSACQIAALNAHKYNVNIDIQQHDIMNDLHVEPFDIVISNPPYIASHVVNTLEKQVKDFEPITALDGGLDGLLFYQRLCDMCTEGKLLKQGGYLVVEIGYDQGQTVPGLFHNGKGQHKLQVKQVVKDLSENDRIVVAQLV